MKYSIVIEGKNVGMVTDETQGLFRVFSAQLPGGEGLLRLSVYGEGREGYLGVMEPCSDGLSLKRKLSRRSLKDFPEKPEYAGLAGMRPAKAVTVEPSEAAPPPAAVKAYEPPETVLSKPIGESTEEQLWFKRPDGSLVAHDGVSGLVALPAQLRREAQGAVLRVIGGRKYMVFRY